MNAIYDLCAGTGGRYSLEYVEKMHHEVPVVPSISREKYLLRQAKGRTVLDIGCTGPMAKATQKIAGTYYGLDIVPNPGIANYYQIDLDKAYALPVIPNLDIVIAGEVIEHLSNPGRFLDLLHGFNVPVVLTTPNAFCVGNRTMLLQEGIESVNKEHVAWYSWRTLATLLRRHHYQVLEWFWYNGRPLFAEGLIFKVRPDNGN